MTAMLNFQTIFNMNYYHENRISDNPEYRKIGKYYRAENAEKVADTYRDDFHDVVVAFAERRLGSFDFYSVWVKDIPLSEVIIKEMLD